MYACIVSRLTTASLSAAFPLPRDRQLAAFAYTLMRLDPEGTGMVSAVDFSRCRAWFEYVPREADAWLADIVRNNSFASAGAPPMGDLDTARSHTLLAGSFGERDSVSTVLRDVMWKTWANSTGLFYKEMLLDMCRVVVTEPTEDRDGDDFEVRHAWGAVGCSGSGSSCGIGLHACVSRYCV